MELLLLILGYVYVQSGIASDLCNVTYTDQISDCYNQTFFALNELPFRDNFPSIFLDLESLMELCKEKNKLDKCITSEIRNACFNSAHISQISFSKSENSSKNGTVHTLMNYLQLEYVCRGNTKQVLNQQHNCIAHQGGKCQFDYNNYATANGSGICATNVITNLCGSGAGCFAQKVLTLQSCYAETESKECSDISYQNNPIKSIQCDENAAYSDGNSLVLTLDLCTDEDKAKIEQCYKDHVFSVIPKNGFRNRFLSAIANETNLTTICESKKRLDECLGLRRNSELPIIQKCFNVEDFKNLTFVDSDLDARTFIAIYLQTDYGCEKFPNLLIEQHTCMFYQGNQCKMDLYNCSTFNAFETCAVERVTRLCGKRAGCFVRKFTALQSCSIPEICGGCHSLNVNNKTFDALCHDDINSGNQYSANIFIVVFTIILSYMFYSFNV
uniref:Uncharacterized protein n=1 Tax=Panagrolaimus davidi TaxID=227884 RepID=A0A914QU06_9BILA